MSRWIAPLLLLALSGSFWPARAAMNQIVEQSGDHVFPDVVTFGLTKAYDCTTLVNGKVGSQTVPNNSVTGCKNCLPGSDPAVCGTDGFGHTGCLVERQDNRWKCIGSFTCADVGASCTTNTECCTGICSGGACVAPCEGLGKSCAVTGDCCLGACVANVCATTSTTTTSTTTTTGATTTTTTLAGGICTPDVAVPVEQRALRTVATSGTCEDNWLPFCDVRNYGAVGDDTTDDSPAFTAAITACCNGGTVYAPRVPTFGSAYRVTQGFNNDEACFFNLVGDGALPFVEASTIHLTTPVNTNCVTGPPRTCDALFDLGGGNAQDIALKGPNNFATNPGVDNENTDGFHNATEVTRVEVTRFTVGVRSTDVIRDSSITSNYIGALDPKEIWRSELNIDNYANLYFDIPATINSHYSTYGFAAYLWIGLSGGNGILSEHDVFTDYGNAGISLTGADVVDLDLGIHGGGVPNVQNNLYKLPLVVVDNAVHLGTVKNSANRIVTTNSLINSAGHCHIDALAAGASVRYVMSDSSAVEISGTCQIDSGSNAAFTVCNNDETQCMPQAIVSLTGGGTPSISEGATVYSVAASGTHLQGLIPSAGACAHFVGQRVTLIFTGTITVDHESGSSTCNIALNGGSAFAAVAGNTLSLIHDGTRWREVARSTPPS